MPNGTYTTYTYSTRSWLTAITHKKSDTSTFLSISYQFDKKGHPTQATENNGDVTDYTYDDLYRLTRETKKDSQQQTLYDYSYTYDAVGNRTKKRDEVAQSDTNYTYNNMNQMTAAGNISYTYDNAGSRLSKTVNQQTTNYTWDFRNRMLKVDFPSGDDPVMRYDGYGTRVEKVVGATTTKFLYAAGAVAFETDGSGTEVAEYRRSSRGALIATERGSTLYWYHFDALGTARALTDINEIVTDTYAYEAWGVSTASSGSTTNPFKFGGAVRSYDDADVGLVLRRGRYYEPETGVFLCRSDQDNHLPDPSDEETYRTVPPGMGTLPGRGPGRDFPDLDLWWEYEVEQPFQDWLWDIWDDVKEPFEQFGDFVVEGAVPISEEVDDAVEATFDWIGEHYDDPWEWIGEHWDDPLEFWWDWCQTVCNGIEDCY